MIDLHFNGTQEEVIRDMMTFANAIAGGLRMQQALAAQAALAKRATAAPAGQPKDGPISEADTAYDTGLPLAAEPVPAGHEMKEPVKRGRPGKKSGIAALREAVNGGPGEAPAPSANDVFEEVPGGVGGLSGEPESSGEAPKTADQPAAPKTVDELRVLINKVCAKAGTEKGKEIVAKYATKLSLIPADKYGAVAADVAAAIGAA